MGKPAWLVSFAKKRQQKALMAPYGNKPYSIQEKAYRFRQMFLWGAVLLAIGINFRYPHHGMPLIVGLIVVWCIEPIPRLILRNYWKCLIIRDPSQRSIRECSPR
jgi:hypothetical protein